MYLLYIQEEINKDWIQGMLLSFGAESFVFQFVIQKLKD